MPALPTELNSTPIYRLFFEKSELRSQLTFCFFKPILVIVDAFFSRNLIVDSVLVAASLCVGNNDVLSAMTQLY